MKLIISGQKKMGVEKLFKREEHFQSFSGIWGMRKLPVSQYRLVKLVNISVDNSDNSILGSNLWYYYTYISEDWGRDSLLGKTDSNRDSWLSRISRLFDRGSIEEETWEELEELLILADVGIETTDKLINSVKRRVKTDKLMDSARVKAALKDEMINMLTFPYTPVNTPPPTVILVVGVNGSGKTTSVAKLAHGYTSQGRRVILGAADTFRAAAIEQLQLWGKRVGAEVIAHKPHSDPGAVTFDAIEAAYSRGVDVVIIDTAGRLHTKSNLMEELRKIRRVASSCNVSAPHQVLLVIDSTTGQNGLNQARAFTQAIGVTDIFLTKLDSMARGGIVFAICDELKIPITYVGTGERLQDLLPFSAENFVNTIFS